jgi:site-specific recombinase XerD
MESTPKLTQAIEGFFIAVSDEFSPSTIELYQWALGLMVSYLGDRELANIQETDLHKFFLWLKTEYQPKRANKSTAPLAGRSRENIWTAMRSFFGWAEKEWRFQRPDRNIERPKYTKREIPPFSEDEIRKLCECAERTRVAKTKDRKPFLMRRRTGVRDRALLLFLVDTGLRASECARVKVEDVDLKAGQVFVTPFGTGRKTKSRMVFLGVASRKAVWRYLNQRKDDLRPSDPLFLTEDNKPMDRDSILHIFQELGDRAGIKSCHPHRCRHTFCSNYIKNGGDPFSLAKIAGFSLDMAMNYVHMVDKDAKAKHAVASPVDNWRL